MKFAIELSILILISLAIVAFMLIITSYFFEFKEYLRINKEKRKSNELSKF